MKTIFGAFTLAAMLFLSACSGEPDSDVASEESAKEQRLASLYSILSDETRAPYKRTVEVVLDERVEEEQLEAIGKAIKAMGEEEVERTFIGYRLASQDPDSAYWGTTHYNPELRVSVSGLTPSKIEAFRSYDPSEHYQDVIGSWRIERGGFNYIAVAYQKGGEIFIVDVFPGEGSNVSRYNATRNESGGLRLQKPDDTFGEYFVITPEGDLQFWSENGHYFTAALRNPEAVDLAP